MLGPTNPLTAVLEAVNLSVIVTSALLVLFLAYYCVQQMRLRGLSWRFAFAAMPIGLALAVAMEVEKSGVLLTRIGVWCWRHLGVGEAVPMNLVERSITFVGIIITAFGMLWLIRLVSRVYFGNWPFYFALLLSLASFVGTLMWRLWK